MKRVLLVNQHRIPHYRVPIYAYLTSYLKLLGFDLLIVSNGIEGNNPDPICFNHIEITLSLRRIVNIIRSHHVDAVIFWVNLKHLFLFPTCLIAKFLLHKKIIYWGHGRDLAARDSTIKNIAYFVEQALSDSIILYAPHLIKYIAGRFKGKVFIANNTLYLDYPRPTKAACTAVLDEYKVYTKKNIICIGRMQKRKRLEHLIDAFRTINRSDIGLIFVGPDPQGILNNVKGMGIFKLGPIYGVKKYELLSAADVCCIPGAVGLSIVDAMYCGLPFVTEEGDESPEIMYLRHGVNGFMVTRGDTDELARNLLLILDNSELQKRFSDAARMEIIINGNIDRMCAGFRDALCFVSGRTT
jgi:glycosyltransferase involved in cell wall biosynthesis